VVKETPLKSYFTQLKGYETDRVIDLSTHHVTMLKLDDYIFVNYKGPKGNPNLYIGYYYSANKAFASHSPLVCYPSQGWMIDTRPRRRSLQVGPHTIEYEEITTSFGDMKELVLYWYQAGLQTNTQVYKNKIDMGYNKLMNDDEQHGFVRVAIPLEGTYEESEIVATDFIKAFYPRFINYISQ
jgi:EpsI family protein